MNSKNPPKSCTSFTLNLLGALCFFIGAALIRKFFPELSVVWSTVIACAFLVVPIVAVELIYYKVHTNPSAKLGKKRPVNNVRVGVKMLGLIGTYGWIVFMYWIFPEYHADFYDRFYDVARYVVPILIGFGWYYFMEVDMRQEDPEDGYWHMGLVLLGDWKSVNTKILAEHFRAWIVKGFFLPLMFIFTINDVDFLMKYDYSRLFADHVSIEAHFITIYDFLYTYIYTIDVMFACVGYAMTFKILDTHIRSVEPTMLGWVVCIVCYPPFWTGLFYSTYFTYDDSFYWGHLTDGYPLIKIIWGCAIIFTIVVYSLATVSLGIRFSNLTYRGLVANGPYRFTKHPAYVSKNLSWWLVSIPFFPSSDIEFTIRASLMLLGINYIYYIRARTEENHLSNYPEYVEYAKWIEENGVFRWVGKLIPYLKYDEARAKSWNSRTWWKQINPNQKDY